VLNLKVQIYIQT